MAQSKSFFGLRKGSTKSLTFQVLNGKQITKDRVYNVKNPQTLAQMQQRALMATAVTAYSNTKVICDHSFEGVEVGAKTMAAFIKNNLQMLSANVPNINVTEYKSGNYAPNKYIVSSGTLPSLKCTETNGEIIYDLGISVGGTSIKWSDIAEKCGLSLNGMMTIMLVSNGTCSWVRLKFTEDVMTSAVSTDTPIIDFFKGKNAIEGDSIELADAISLDKETDTNALRIMVSSLNEEGVALILSEKKEGAWRRSTESLHYTKLSTFYDTAFMTYPINTTLLLNGGKMSSNKL